MLRNRRKDRKNAEEAGVKLKYTAFAREAFVFIVDINNPVNSLSEHQVKDIFSGKTSRWNKVGGSDEHIKVWQRPEDSEANDYEGVGYARHPNAAS